MYSSAAKRNTGSDRKLGSKFGYRRSFMSWWKALRRLKVDVRDDALRHSLTVHSNKKN